MKMNTEEKINWLTSGSAEAVNNNDYWNLHYGMNDDQVYELATKTKALEQMFDSWFEAEKATGAHSDCAILESQINIPENMLEDSEEYSALFRKYSDE